MVTLFIAWLLHYAHAQKILIVSDQPGLAFANQTKELLSTTPPFNRIYGLEIEVLSLRPDQLECRIGSHKIDRIITCDSKLLSRLRGEHGANRVIAVKDNKTYAAAGGEFAAVTTAMTPKIAMHELLHSFGFRDEYAYDEKEVDHYCYLEYFGLTQTKNGPNVAFFKDEPPYTSDAAARARHAGDIPWFGRIKPSTLITTGQQLGTPREGKIGLYPSKTCLNSKQPLKAWKPGSEVTLMEDMTVTYIPEVSWEAIANGLDGIISRGTDSREATALPRDADTESAR